MSTQQKEDLLTALLHIQPEAEVRHLDNLIKTLEAKGTKDIHMGQIIDACRIGALKLPK